MGVSHPSLMKVGWSEAIHCLWLNREGCMKERWKWSSFVLSHSTLWGGFICQDGAGVLAESSAHKCIPRPTRPSLWATRRLLSANGLGMFALPSKTALASRRQMFVREWQGPGACGTHKLRECWREWLQRLLSVSVHQFHTLFNADNR